MVEAYLSKILISRGMKMQFLKGSWEQRGRMRVKSSCSSYYKSVSLPKLLTNKHKNSSDILVRVDHTHLHEMCFCALGIDTRGCGWPAKQSVGCFRRRGERRGTRPVGGWLCVGVAAEFRRCGGIGPTGKAAAGKTGIGLLPSCVKGRGLPQKGNPHPSSLT